MKSRLWTASYIFMIVLNILICFSFYMIMTLLTSYITGIGGSVAAAGVIVGAFSITSLIVRPFTGFLTDEADRRGLLIIGGIVVAISIVGYTMTANMAIIFLFRILHGIAFALNSTAIIALAGEVIPADRLGEGIGYIGLGNIIASAAGPGFGVMLTDRFGVRLTFAIAALFSLAAAVLLMFYRKPERVVTGDTSSEEKPQEKREHFSFNFRNLISWKVLDYSFVAGCYSILNGVVGSFLVLFTAERGIPDVGLYFTVCAVFLFLARPLSGKIVDKKGLSCIIYPAIMMSVISILMLIGAHSLTVLLVSAALRSLAQGAIQPSLQAACIKKTGVERSGVATSTYYLGCDVGQGIGPMIAGAIAMHHGYVGAFGFCIVMMAAGCVVYTVTRSRK